MVMDEKQNKVIDQFGDFMKNENAKAYRNKIKENIDNSIPCIPYIGQHLTDLTFSEDGNKFIFTFMFFFVFLFFCFFLFFILFFFVYFFLTKQKGSLVVQKTKSILANIFIFFLFMKYLTHSKSCQFKVKKFKII